MHARAGRSPKTAVAAGLQSGPTAVACAQAVVALPVVAFLLLAEPVELEDMKGPGDMDALMDEAIAHEQVEQDAGGAPPAQQSECTAVSCTGAPADCVATGHDGNQGADQAVRRGRADGHPI